MDKTEVRVYPSGVRQIRKLCRCECGKEEFVGEYKLRIGHSRSCGCLQSEVTTERSLKHGHSKRGERSRAYSVWRNIINRCTNPNVASYADYGGRGITICDRWLNSFENFLQDMGEPPEGRTIDRIDNNKGYYRENCAWNTPVQQARNRRNSITLTFNGMTMTLPDWAELLDVPYSMLKERLYRGWSVEKILMEPKN